MRVWVIFAAVCVCVAFTQTLPPSGLYLSLSQSALTSSVNTLTADVVEKVNKYTAWPEVSGKSSQARYTFKNWKVEIALVNPTWKSIAKNEIALGWTTFNFSIKADYHVCANSWPNPCEDGNLYIYTTDSHVQLYLDVVMEFDKTPAFLNVTASSLSFQKGEIEIYVHCVNTICLIPVSDIASAVASNFYSVFTQTVAKSAEEALKENVKEIATQFEFKDGLGMDLESEWWVLSDKALMFVPEKGGFFTYDEHKHQTFPPFNPSFTPPEKYLEAPAQDINIAITEYFFQSLMWSFGNLGIFDKTITPAEVPKESPVQLSTNDQFFQGVIPALVNYPNMGITITTKLVSPSMPTIDTTGVKAYGTNVTFDFTLSNSTYKQHGWTLSNVFNVELAVTATLTSRHTVTFNASIASFSSSVTVLESNCGNITAAGFQSLYSLLQSVVKLPGFVLTLPDTFYASNPTISFFPHYIGFGANVEYKPVNVQTLQPVKPVGNVVIA